MSAVLNNVALGQFFLLALVATHQWHRHRSRGAVWAALAFLVLGVVAVVDKVVTDTSPDLWTHPWFSKAVIGFIFLMPYCLFRFADSFHRSSRLVRAAAAVSTLGVIVFSELLRYLPFPGMAAPPDYLAYRIAVALQWGFLFTFVVVRLWKAGHGQTTTAANRMRLLAAATAGLDVQIVVGALGLSSHSAVALGGEYLSVAMGFLFLLAFVLPASLRSWWSRVEDTEFRETVADLITDGSSQDIARSLMRHVCGLTGGSSAVLLDAQGNLVACYPNDATSSADRQNPGNRAETLVVKARHGAGHQLTVQVSKYMPYFGRAELRKLQDLADLLDLAMERCALVKREREATLALAHQALHDPLTGLPNRDLFVDRLTQALAILQRHEGEAAVMFIDIDRFKLINDRFDHSTGDSVLIEMAHRLRSMARSGDTVARVGGDEFLAVVEVKNENEAKVVAERMRKALSAPLEIEDLSISVTASIGVVVTRRHDDDPARLMREADAAMYMAKEAGRDQVQLFDDDVRRRTLDVMDLERDLLRAIDAGELRLHYQPVFRLSDGLATGVEALVRWEHPELGLLAPDMFIPLAEESGLIVPLGAWVLTEACRQAAQWVEVLGTGEPFTMWVNKSAGQFYRVDVVKSVLNTLAAAGLDSSYLGVEITENVFMSDTEQLRTTLSDLKAHGLAIAIDDFGTGFSSLGYLKRFPVDVLKIDRSFVEGIGREPETSLVTACLAMAKSLDIGTVAEGVESLEQGAWLTGAGCDHAQGHGYCHPVEADAALAILMATRDGANHTMALAHSP